MTDNDLNLLNSFCTIMELWMRSLLALLLLLSCSLPAWAEVRASLDRYSLTAADVLTLTLETTDQLEQRPDLTPLEGDFSVLSSRKVIISSHSSSSRAVRTRWELQLRPRTTGKIRIPPLRLGSDLSASMEVEVTGNLAPTRNRGNLFMDSLLSQDQIYSHAQLLYTARVFHTEPLPESARFQPPQLPEALVIPLTEKRSYETDRGGESWQITEQAFALFPSNEGLHTLRGARLVLDDDSDVTPNAIALAPVESFEIEVLPQAHHSQRGYWLPAERLSFEEQAPLPDSLQPGESFVREISLTALGLPADALPSLFVAELDSAFARTEDVSLTETATPQGLVSTRTERILIEPLGEGGLVLPAIDIHWWNTLSDRGQILTLPGRQLEIDMVSLPPVTDSSTPVARDATNPSSPSRILVAGLGLLSIISSLGWLYSWHQLRQLRNRDKAASQEVQAAQAAQLHRSHQQAERNTFQALAIACQQNDAGSTQQRLIDWGQQFWLDHHVHSLTSLCEAAGSQALDFLIMDLEHHLRHEPTLWQGDLLLEALETMRRRRLRNAEPNMDSREQDLLMVS
jgi:hypothetical protein